MAQFFKVFRARWQKKAKREKFFADFQQRFEKLNAHPKGEPWLAEISNKYGSGFGLIKVQYKKGLAEYEDSGFFDDGIPMELVFTTSHILLCDQQFKPGTVINALAHKKINKPRVDFGGGDKLIFNYLGDKVVMHIGGNLDAIPVMEVMKDMLKSSHGYPMDAKPPEIQATRQNPNAAEVVGNFPNLESSAMVNAAASKPIVHPEEPTFQYYDNTQIVMGPAPVGQILSMINQGQLTDPIFIFSPSTNDWRPITDHIHSPEIQIRLKHKCSNCNQNVAYPEAMDGKKIRCPHCSEVVRLSNNS
jgi:DNA-directed RNA polymerase subunit RPC12/RpoP